MTLLEFVADDEQATARFAARLAGALPESIVVALIGTLGAGKTRFVQALATAAGIPAATVQSPTFTLVHEYRGPRTIFHFDAYRLRDEDEFEALGCAEYFDAPAWSLIEWADRVPACLPPDHLEIHITPTGPTSRHFSLKPHGPVSAAVIERLSD